MAWQAAIGPILSALFSWLGSKGGGTGTGGANDPELQALMRQLLQLQNQQTLENQPLRRAVSALAFKRLPTHARAGFSMLSPEGSAGGGPLDPNDPYGGSGRRRTPPEV